MSVYFKEKILKNKSIMNWLSWYIALFIFYSLIIILHVPYSDNMVLGFLWCFAFYCFILSFVLIMPILVMIIWIVFDYLKQLCNYFIVKVLLNSLILFSTVIGLLFVGLLGFKYYDFLIYLGGMIHV